MARGVFESDKVLYGDPRYIPALAEKICMVFSQEGYEVKTDNLLSGTADVSITKGGFFKSALGLKSALKIKLEPDQGNIHITAGVGIFGQQALPTAVTMLVAWPVILTQIWGMVKQSQLDDRAIDIAETELRKLTHTGDNSSSNTDSQSGENINGDKFCPACGAKTASGARFCSSCGAKLQE